MPPRLQRTIARRAEVGGFGFFSGADVRLTFRPADDDFGIVFERTDLPGSPQVAATIGNAVPRSRRTAVAAGEAVVELTEHVLAALAGLRVDNCLIQLNAPEPPGCDGSSRAFAEAILEAGVVEQSSRRATTAVPCEVLVADDAAGASIAARPLERDALLISFGLDYGPASPIPPQVYSVEVTPETFLGELAFARTFVLESEVAALKAQGYGTRVTPRDLLVFGEKGVIDNELRADEECVRHKILDCIGDFALIGCDLSGHVSASRSGHRLNRELVRRIVEQTAGGRAEPAARAA